MTVWICDLTVVLPLTQQKDFTSGFRRHAKDGVDVLVFHRQDQIGFTDGCRGQLRGVMNVRDMTVLDKDTQGSRFDGAVLQRVKARGADDDVRRSQGIAQ